MSELEVPEGWTNKKINQLCDVVRGGSPRPKGDPKYFGGEIPWIKISDVTASKGKFLEKTKEGLTQEGIPKSRFLKSGSLILTNSATICLPKIMKIDGCIHDGFLSFLNLDDQIQIEFLYYFFLAMRQKITDNVARGLAQKNLNRELVGNIDFFYPNIKIQKQIVAKLDHILGELEEKKKQILTLIENNKERINFFEKNWLSYVIDREIEHHPERKNWESKILSEEIEDYEKRNPGNTPDKEFKYVEISSVSDDKKIENFRTLLGRNAPSRARNVIRENDVIYGTTRPYYRNVVLIPKEFDNQICSTGFCVLRSSTIEPEFLFYFMLSDTANKQILKPMRGGNYPAVSNPDVTSIKIPLPKNLETQKQIIKNIKSAEEKFQSQKEQFENIKNSYESTIKYIEHMQSSILDAAFSGKLVK